MQSNFTLRPSPTDLKISMKIYFLLETKKNKLLTILECFKKCKQLLEYQSLFLLETTGANPVKRFMSVIYK
jgi:hypothetical protein